ENPSGIPSWEGRGPSGPGVGSEVGNGPTPAAFGRHPSREGIFLGGESLMRVSTASRRRFLTTSLLAAGPILTAAPLPGLQSTEIKAGLKVVCVGGHPDDPESGCAGTLALYQELGNIPTIVYLTRGERGIQGKSNDEAAQIRSAECESACKVLGVKARFAGQVDGSADFTRTRVDEIQKILAEER